MVTINILGPSVLRVFVPGAAQEPLYSHARLVARIDLLEDVLRLAQVCVLELVGERAEVKEPDSGTPGGPVGAVDQDIEPAFQVFVYELEGGLQKFVRDVVRVLVLDEVEEEAVVPPGDLPVWVVLGELAVAVFVEIAVVRLPGRVYDRPAVVVLYDGFVIGVGPYKEVVEDLYHVRIIVVIR